MKKMLCAAMAAAMVMGTCASVFADGIGVSVNDNLIEAQGVIVESRTLVPVRGVFEELGYSVDWDAETKTATLTGEKTVVIQSGGTTFTVDGEEITPEVPQQIIEDRFMLPLRAIGEAVGAAVDWDAETKTVIITTDGAEVVEDTTEETTEHTGGLKIGGVQEL
ncbi:MAG: copper amine oxidase N-terminal domain-containing protein [Firmicutes bacterium]|nr:copper amine oxidase N-terminal domain-containing protein [Bacillota bacterium]